MKSLSRTVRALRGKLVERNGFALPMVILVIALLTVSLAAAYTLVSSERRVADDQSAQAAALTVAQGALERVVNDHVGYAFAGSPLNETRSVSVPGGTAQVTIRRLRAVAGQPDTSYLVVARGIYSRPGLPLSPMAERTVSQVMVRGVQNLRVFAALTSVSGLDKNGASSNLNGTDTCGVAPPVAGVAVPNGGHTGHTTGITGSPAIAQLGDEAATRDSVKINWNGILNENAMTFSHTDASSTPTWPGSGWPVVRFTATNVSFGGGGSGNGVMVVDGNLTLSGNFGFTGLILVGGTFTSNGNQTVNGAVVSGLNELLGVDVPASSTGNGNKTFRYSSCAVASAMSAIAQTRRFRAVPNSWSDSWATY